MGSGQARRLDQDGAVDTDAALRDALSHESVEVLRHQVSVERDATVRMRRGDMVLSFLLAGLGAGVGWAGASGSFRRWTKRKGRRKSR